MRRRWIMPPAIWNANPPTQSSNKMIAIVSKTPIHYVYTLDVKKQ